MDRLTRNLWNAPRTDEINEAMKAYVEADEACDRARQDPRGSRGATHDAAGSTRACHLYRFSRNNRSPEG
jgi:hypothetical protein